MKSNILIKFLMQFVQLVIITFNWNLLAKNVSPIVGLANLIYFVINVWKIIT